MILLHGPYFMIHKNRLRALDDTERTLTKYLAVICFLFVLAVSPAIVSTVVLLLVAKCTAGCIISQ